MLRSLILVPLFNLLIFIYALLPGHDLGVAIILFTVTIRFVLWPVLRKQIHQQKAMRELQPEIAKIKKKAKGNRQKESTMMMELYKEREINPLASLGPLLIQLPILITLFIMLRNLFQIESPEALTDLLQQDLYGFIHEIGFVSDLISNPGRFNTMFFGVIDLQESNILLAATAGLGQFMQSRILQPKDDDAKTLRSILSDAKEGKEVKPSEQNAAMMRSASKFLPILTFVFAYNLPAALALYWTTSSVVASLQQRVALGHEVKLLSAFSSKTSKNNDDAEDDKTTKKDTPQTKKPKKGKK